jgi:glycosyltransferase involved in cell wall biosynthesis
VKTPEVSVVIAAYNCRDFILETISSVINQTFQSWELIIVDDCSSDDTSEIIASLSDNRIRTIRLDKNSGLPAKPRNIGIQAAKGEFIAFLDHDDIWSPEKLKIQINCLRKDPEAALIACPLKISSPDRKYNNTKTTPMRKHQAGYLYDKLLQYNFIACSSVVVKASVLDEIGLFDEDPRVSAAEDWDLWLRIARRYKTTFIPQTLGTYRMHGSGLSTETKQIKRILYVIDKHIKNDWVTIEKANKAKANFYFVEGWFIIGKDARTAKEMFRKALNLNKINPKILCGSLLGLLLSIFPNLCKFIKNNYLDRKIKHILNLEN